MDIEKFQDELDKVNDSELLELLRDINANWVKQETSRREIGAKNICIEHEIWKRKLKEAFPGTYFIENSVVVEIEPSEMLLL